MGSYPAFARKWDREVKEVAIDVAQTCKSDAALEYYVGQMIFYIEHDLADDRPPHLRLYPCVGTFNDESYYTNVHSDSPKEEVQKIRKLGRLLNELLNS